MKQASLNPIVPGFAPDPSIVHVDGYFFLVNSSFHLFPGLPIYASKDLSSWKHIGNAINRQSQLSLLKTRTAISPPCSSTDNKPLLATAGLYAPTIRHHAGTFYIVCTNAKRNVDNINKPGAPANKGNFIITTTDIWRGEWSDPIYFSFNGIDPSITFDPSGRAYIQGSGGRGPGTLINQFEIDLETGARLSKERTIWTGTGGVYPEGPHVFFHEGWWHLLIAEGGTHNTHAVTAARARDIWGPYEADPANPVLTARDTPGAYVQHTGHCDVVQDSTTGQWWAVCLAVRKAGEGRYHLSRETFLTPVRWEKGWLKMEPVGLDVVDHAGKKLPGLELETEPGLDFVYIRDAKLDRYKFLDGDVIELTASSVDLSEPEESPTFVGKRQRVLEGKSTCFIRRVEDGWGAAKMKCGLVYYKDEFRYFRIYFDAPDRSVVFEVVNVAQKISRTTRRPLEGVPPGLSFQIKYTETEFRLEYALEAGSTDWISLATVDTLEMTDPDFVGPVIGVFALSEADGHQVEFQGFSVE